MSSPWGLERAMLFAKHRTLPPRGGIQDQLLRVMHHRDQLEKVAFLRAILLHLQELQAPSKRRDALFESSIALYADYVFHDAYENKAAAAAAADTAKRLLDVVDKMTVSDDDVPLKKKQKKAPKRR